MFNILVFTIPFLRGAVFWIAYFFTSIAFASQIVIFKIAFEKANSLRRVFLGFPIVKIGYTFLTLQLIICAGLMIRATFVPFMQVWIAIVPSVILLACTAISVIFSDAARERIEQLEIKQIVSTTFITNLQADLASLLPRISDNDLRVKTEKLSEAVRYSDPVSNEELTELEETISRQFLKLKQAVLESDSIATGLADELSFLLNERNNKCKMLKRKLSYPDATSGED
jgi:hypothetical protein